MPSWFNTTKDNYEMKNSTDDENLNLVMQSISYQLYK